MTSPDDFKEALGRFPSGVTVITAQKDGETHGMTASAFMSVSLDPPLVLESVGKKARMHSILMEAERYGVSILNTAQAEASNHFAGFGKEDYNPRFEDLNNFPVIDGAVAQLVCKIVDKHEAGDHTLFIAQVEAVNYNDDAPILYYRRKYGQFDPQS